MGNEDIICSEWIRERAKHPSFGEGKDYEDMQRMWNESATTYSDSQYSAISDDIVSALLSEGIVNKDSTILDIGCGTGSFALRFSPHVSKVIGSDSSPKMLERLMDNASERNVNNIDPLLSDCLSIPSDVVCDVAFSSLCPPMNDPESLLSMEAHSKRYCIYVSSANVGNGIEGEVWKALGCDYSYSGYDTTYPFEYLRSIGKDARLRFFTQRNQSIIPIEECVNRYLRLVSKYRGMNGDMEHTIRDVIASHAKDGNIDLSREMRMGMLIWEV